MEKIKQKQIRHFLFYLALSLFAASVLLIAAVLFVVMVSFAVNMTRNPDLYQTQSFPIDGAIVVSVVCAVLALIAVAGLIFGVRKADNHRKKLKAVGAEEAAEDKEEKPWQAVLLTVATVILFLIFVYFLVGAISLMF